MKPKYWLLLSVAVAGALESAACSSSFHSCDETRTCTSTAGAGAGTAGRGDAGDTSNAPDAGAPTDSEMGGQAGGGGEAGESSTTPDAGAAGEAGAVGVMCDASVDLKTDPKNCGSCGHDCLGGDCTLGKCQPIEIAKDQGTLFTVAVDEHFIYWGGDGSSIAKKSIDNSGARIELAPAAAREFAYNLLAVGQTLYWSNDWKDNAVRGCALPLCSNGPQDLIVAGTPARRLFYGVGDSTMYFTQEKSIWKKALPAGLSTQLTPTTDIAANIASDGTYLYWTEFSTADKTSAIRKIAVTGGAGSDLATGLNYLERLVAHKKLLYVLENPTDGTGVSGDARILMLPLPNGLVNATIPAFANAGKLVGELAVDDSGVYWTEMSAEGSVRHCPLIDCAGSPEVLASAMKPRGITTDALAVYWVTTDGHVMKLAK
jgi:hypothetical protein